MKRILSIVALLTLAACGGEIEPGSRSGEPQIISGLVLGPVTESVLPGGESYVGTVESRNRGVLLSRTDGRIDRIAVGEGEAVEAGALLLTIADNQAADRLREAQAAGTGAQKRLLAARARADLAQKTFERYRKLFRSEAVTPQEMDRVSAELEEARQGVAAAEADVAGTESVRGSARTALAYTRVTAPYAARVVRKEVEVGSTVQPGTPLLVLDSAEGWHVRSDIPEAKAGQVAPGETVQVEIPSLGKTLSARIIEVQPGVDPRSRTFQVKAVLPPVPGLAAGLFARLVLPGSGEPTVLVPASAVVARGQLTGVYLVKEGILHYRLVKTGRTVAGRLEILSGLDPGETVVVEGVERARSGARAGG